MMDEGILPDVALLRWHVVYTRPRWEKKIAEELTRKGIENYCPLQPVVRQWSDRKKTVIEPVFKSYVFVAVAITERWQVLETNGVLNFVYYLKKPAIIRSAEIATIRQFLGENKNATLSPISIIAGQKVMISTGVLTGHEAQVVNIQNNKVQVIIESLGMMLKATIGKDAISIYPV